MNSAYLLDILFLVYFVVHIPIAIFVDSQAIFPKWCYPKTVCIKYIKYIIMILSCIIQVDTSMVILYYKGDNSNINLQKLFNDVLILHLYAMYTEYKTQFKEYSNEISC